MNPLDAIPVYLASKAAWSRANDALLFWAPRSTVLRFTSARAAADYYASKGNPYTGDPMGGALDHYRHPERTQAYLDGKDSNGGRVWIDCDDVALYYERAIRSSTIGAKVVTLVDERIVMSHVVCVGADADGAFLLDTNGYRQIADTRPETIIAAVGAIYPAARYVAALDTPLPW